MNSKNSKMSDTHRLLLKLTDKINLKRSDNYVALPNICIFYTYRNRTTLRKKTGYYLELLTPEVIKLFGSTKSKTTKDKNGENVPHLEITEVVLLHCNILSNDYQQDSRVLYTFVPNKSFVQLLDISSKNF